ncbi:hypothetical protein FOPG_19880 [Fusarium oxysporum f. sp. conglutinans race 2 54008]|uniref:Secreted protein n=1 Tax=Fusarium oxysporum f. sp. conglutinans race 2 54008 TaxID=1089457 RepID=X0HRP2_FUSOX|nr:hypothetical protein FOPG_19880 [Fusarium oxysporum f. sp. conglutinans race 2 54008]
MEARLVLLAVRVTVVLLWMRANRPGPICEARARETPPPPTAKEGRMDPQPEFPLLRNPRPMPLLLIVA